MALLGKIRRPTVTIEAVITRADGTVENLGVICRTKPDGLFRRLIKLIKGGK